MRRFVLLVVVNIILLTACGASSNSSNSHSNEAPATVPAEYSGKQNPYGAEMAPEGDTFFQANCQMCHGAQGRGDGPAGASLVPKPKNLAAFQNSVGDDYLFWRISEGKPGTFMLAWKGSLTEDQIWKIVSFIRTLKE